jgi:hypothetical protein
VRTADRYLLKEHWQPLKETHQKLFINQHYDCQVTVGHKLLDELDVFGAITYTELLWGALRTRADLRKHLPRGIVNPKTGALKSQYYGQIISSDLAAQYWHPIRRWFDLKVGCGAQAYLLAKALLTPPRRSRHRRHQPSDLPYPSQAALRIIKPTQHFKKALVIAPTVAALQPLITAAVRHNLIIDVAVE